MVDANLAPVAHRRHGRRDGGSMRRLVMPCLTVGLGVWGLAIESGAAQETAWQTPASFHLMLAGRSVRKESQPVVLP